MSTPATPDDNRDLMAWWGAWIALVLAVIGVAECRAAKRLPDPSAIPDIDSYEFFISKP